MKIGIYSSSATDLDSRYYDLAYDTGLELARKGHSLVYGGYLYGIMGSAARGFRDGGGEIFAVVPELLDRPGYGYAECTEVYITEDLAARKKKMEDMADIFIALPGGIGTLDELFNVMAEKNLGMTDKEIILLNVYGVFDGLETLLAHLREEGFIKTDTLRICRSEEELLALL